MSKLTAVKKAAKLVGLRIGKHSPTILIGIGCAGVVTTAVLSSKAGANYHQLRAAKAIELEKEVEDLTFVENLDALWKNYISTVLMGGLTLTCILGGNHIHLRRSAALASLYSMANVTLKEYQAKVAETIGKNKERKMRDDISKDHIDAREATNVIITGKGDTLFLESGQYFRSSVNKIEKIANDINWEINSQSGFVSLNEFYDALGIERIRTGDDVGWGTGRSLLEVSFGAHVKDGEPCMELRYEVFPKYDCLRKGE